MRGATILRSAIGVLLVGMVGLVMHSVFGALNSKRIANIAYADVSTRQKLDLYLPDGIGPFPLVVVIHGGGFKSGHKRAANPRAVIAAGLARRYAVASINYRRSGEALFPAAVEDVISAIRFLQDTSSEYGLDPNRVAVWGASAGGNLAAMAALNDDTDVRAAVIWFGPIKFDQMDAQFVSLGLDPMLGPTNGPDSPESQYLGIAVGDPEASNLVKSASPLSYISPDDPAILIQHGTSDRNVPFLQSAVFADALSEVLGSDKVEFDKMTGAGHGGEAFLNENNLERVFSFLKAHLQN